MPFCGLEDIIWITVDEGQRTDADYQAYTAEEEVRVIRISEIIMRNSACMIRFMNVGEAERSMHQVAFRSFCQPKW